MTGRSKQGKGDKWRPMLYEGETFVGILGSPHGFETKEQADRFGQGIMSEGIYWEMGPLYSSELESAPSRSFRQ